MNILDNFFPHSVILSSAETFYGAIDNATGVYAVGRVTASDPTYIELSPIDKGYIWEVSFSTCEDLLNPSSTDLEQQPLLINLNEPLSITFTDADLYTHGIIELLYLGYNFKLTGVLPKSGEKQYNVYTFKMQRPQKEPYKLTTITN